MDDEVAAFSAVGTLPQADGNPSPPTSPHKARRLEESPPPDPEGLYCIIDKYRLESDATLCGAVMEHFTKILQLPDPKEMHAKFKKSMDVFLVASFDIQALETIHPILNAVKGLTVHYSGLYYIHSDCMEVAREMKARYPHIKRDWGYIVKPLDHIVIRERFTLLSNSIAHLSWMYCKRDISLELATSEAAKVFENVSNDVPKALTNAKTCQFVLEAGIWDYLITKVFPQPSAIWGGRFGKMLEELCFETRRTFL